MAFDRERFISSLQYGAITTCAQVRELFQANGIVNVDDLLSTYDYNKNVLEIEGGASLVLDVARLLFHCGQVAVGSRDAHWPVIVAKVAQNWLSWITGWVVEITNLHSAPSAAAAKSLLYDAAARNEPCSDPRVTFPPGTKPVGFELRDA